jgi:two-component system sensor histidine kinase HydH
MEFPGTEARMAESIHGTTISAVGTALAPVRAEVREPVPAGLHGRDRLSAAVVHDLRNPLATISGCAEMLLDGNLAPVTAARLVSNINHAANRMQELLAGLARRMRGHAETAETCNLRALIARAVEAAGLSERNEMTVRLDVPSRLEMALVCARIECVFLNLIVNAMEAMSGGGTIRITAKEMGKCVAITVEDNGPGIPAAIRDRLFEPFVTSGKKEGLGLGLALSRQTVREHGGEMWIEHAAGARFVISLPLQRPVDAVSQTRRVVCIADGQRILK